MKLLSHALSPFLTTHSAVAISSRTLKTFTRYPTNKSFLHIQIRYLYVIYILATTAVRVPNVWYLSIYGTSGRYIPYGVNCFFYFAQLLMSGAADKTPLNTESPHPQLISLSGKCAWCFLASPINSQFSEFQRLVIWRTFRGIFHRIRVHHCSFKGINHVQGLSDYPLKI